MNLTDHFTLEEFTVSNTAARMGIDNTPNSARVRGNLTRTAQLMERIREALGQPIIVTSGYRSPALNRAVGGVATSAHTEGLACDFICPAFGTPLDVCRGLEPYVEALGIDQLIYEHTWVHVGLLEAAPRHQVLTLVPGGGYVAGIVG
jgi:zinc D-Ala-D-Ala carboxypeptidase